MDELNELLAAEGEEKHQLPDVPTDELPEQKKEKASKSRRSEEAMVAS